MHLLGAITSLVVAAVLLAVSVIMDNASKDAAIKTDQSCVLREQARIASPTKFNTNPCFQWDGRSCRHGDITAKGCDIHSSSMRNVLTYLSMISFSVGVVLFFVPTKSELVGKKAHHRQHNHHHSHHHKED